MNVHITAEKSNPVGGKWSQVQVKESETPQFDFGRLTRTPSPYEPRLVDSVGHVLSRY